MIIKKPFEFKSINEKMDLGNYFFYFKEYKVGSVDLVYEALRLIENREINFMGYKIKTYSIFKFKENNQNRYRIRLDIKKDSSIQKIEGIPILTIALILTGLGLIGLIVYGILYRIEKILAEIPDVLFVLVGLGIIFSLTKK